MAANIPCNDDQLLEYCIRLLEERRCFKIWEKDAKTQWYFLDRLQQDHMSTYTFHNLIVRRDGYIDRNLDLEVLFEQLMSPPDDTP